MLRCHLCTVVNFVLSAFACRAPTGAQKTTVKSSAAASEPRRCCPVLECPWPHSRQLEACPEWLRWGGEKQNRMLSRTKGPSGILFVKRFLRQPAILQGATHPRNEDTSRRKISRWPKRNRVPRRRANSCCMTALGALSSNISLCWLGVV